MKNTRILAVANQKGGVGKTTTCMNLAAALVEQGKKVLLVDNDSQCNLTSYLRKPNSEIKNNKSTTDELYLTKNPPVFSEARERFIQSYQVGMDFIAGHKDLAGVEQFLYSRADRELVLKKNLGWVYGEYDFVFIDNPPSINLLTLNAIVAAHQVLIPVQTEYFSLEGLEKMEETIELVRARWNPGLKIAGIVPTRVDRRKKLTNEVLSLIKAKFPNDPILNQVRDSSKVAESSGYGKTILAYAPSSKGADDYRDLADHLLQS